MAAHPRGGEGILLNYQLAMNLLLRKESERLILKPRPPKDKLFAQACSIEEFCKNFQITAVPDQSLDHNSKIYGSFPL